jgi:hypothetical protein
MNRPLRLVFLPLAISSSAPRNHTQRDVPQATAPYLWLPESYYIYQYMSIKIKNSFIRTCLILSFPKT